MFPVIVPTAQVNELGVLAVSVRFGLDPLQVLMLGALVTVVAGFTVTVIV